MSRRLAREIVIQALYQTVVHPDDPGWLIRQRAEQLDPDSLSFYNQLKQGVTIHQSELDQVITRFLKSGWSLSRLSYVEQAILRLAVYELLYEKQIPYKATLNEAIDLAKSFGGEESKGFINGVLGSIVKSLEKNKLANS